MLDRPLELSSSSYTLDSSYTSLATTSTSSGSTIPGIGALSGKAILALGKLTLRGAENVIIRRRLAVIGAKFPPTSATDVKVLERMYDDLLELSRVGMYPEAIRDQAMKMLLVQIGVRHTLHIIKCLKKWPDVEIQIFMSELMTIFDPIRLSRREAIHETKIKAYWSALAAWESHSLAPFVDFCDQLAQSLIQSSVTIVQAGALNFLLHAYVTGFSDPIAKDEQWSIHRTSALHVGCNSLLKSLCNTKEGLAMIRDHPFHVLWPSRPTLPFTPQTPDRTERRVTVWNAASKDIVLWRVHSISEIMLDWTRTFNDSLMYDICGDLLEISGSASMDLETTMHALGSLHRVFSHRHTNRPTNAIMQYLASNTTEHCVKIISQIIRRLSRIIPPNTPESKFFFLDRDHEDLFITAVPRFLTLFLTLAEAEDLRTIILAADVLGLMRPFLEIELRGQIAPHDDDLFTVYDPPDFAFLALIKEHGLENLLPDPPPHEKAKFAFAYRRKVLCRAFNVFLGCEDILLLGVHWHGTIR